MIISKGNWDALDANPNILHDGLAADFAVVIAIHRRLQKHPERNPLRVFAFTELVGLAIAAWDDESIGNNPDDYINNLLDLYPGIRQKLIDRGYLSDVEVAVEADTADDAAEAPVEALSHS